MGQEAENHGKHKKFMSWFLIPVPVNHSQPGAITVPSKAEQGNLQDAGLS